MFTLSNIINNYLDPTFKLLITFKFDSYDVSPKKHKSKTKNPKDYKFKDEIYKLIQLNEYKSKDEMYNYIRSNFDILKLKKMIKL